MAFSFVRIALVCLFLGGFGWLAGAQGIQSPNPNSGGMTLADAIQQALARNRDLAVARSEEAISRGRLQQARIYPYNPELILEGDAGRGEGRDNNGDRRSLWGGRVGLGQVLEIRGQRGLRTRIAEQDKTRVQWEVHDAEREVIAATMRAFSELLVMQERLGLTRQVAALVTQLENTARELARAGAVPELDALRAEVERQRVATRLTLEEASLASARRNLNVIIGAQAGNPVRVTGLLLFEPVKEKPDALIENAKTLRPDIKAAEASLKSAETALRLIRAERFLPSLTVSASYAQGAEYDAEIQRGILGISIPLPLINRREGDMAAAEAAVRKGEAQRNQILARVEKEITTAYDQYGATQKVVAVFAERIVPGTEENAKLVQEGYRLGEFRLTDALLIQRDLFDTRSAYLEAVAAYNRAVTDLYWSVGVRP